MKKTFTFLLGLLGLASSVNAENLPIAGGWQWTVPMYSCSVTFNQQWAELGLCSTIGNGGLSLSDYKGVKITFNADGTPVADKLQIKVKNAAGTEQYSSNDGSATMSLTFNSETFANDPTITVLNLQAKEKDITAKIDKVVLIKSDDSEEDSECSADWNKCQSWGCTAESTSKTISFSQWGQLGNWTMDVEEGASHIYTFTFGGNGVGANDFQIKYTDASSVEHYSDVSAGTSFSYTVKESYTNFCLQAKAATQVEILSITREIEQAALPTELNEDGSFPQLTVDDKVDLKIVRSFNSGWNTFCVPTFITPPNIRKYFGDNVKVFSFSGYENGKLNFAAKDLSDQYNWTIDGYEPYLIYIDDSDAPALSGSFTILDALIRGNADNNGYALVGSAWPDNSGVAFQGTYETLSADALVGNYGLTPDGKIQKAGAGASLKGYRGYFTGIPEEAAAKGISIVFDNGTTTGISTVVPAEDVFGNGAVYNLNGQRVGKNLAPGIYVRNGKKFIQK